MLESNLKKLNIVIESHSNSSTSCMLNRNEDACDKDVYKGWKVGRIPNLYPLLTGYTDHGTVFAHKAGMEY